MLCCRPRRNFKEIYDVIVEYNITETTIIFVPWTGTRQGKTQLQRRDETHYVARVLKKNSAHLNGNVGNGARCDSSHAQDVSYVPSSWCFVFSSAFGWWRRIRHILFTFDFLGRRRRCEDELKCLGNDSWFSVFDDSVYSPSQEWHCAESLLQHLLGHPLHEDIRTQARNLQ